MELSSILNPETEDERREQSTERGDDPEGPHRPGGSGGQNPAIPGRKYPCKVCQRIFTTSGHLSRHMKVHTGERKYVCPFPGCDVKCNRSDNLLQHYRVHLPKEERKLGNTHVRDHLRRMNSYTSSSSSTGQVSPAVSEPQEYFHGPSQSPAIRQHGPTLSPQHASTSQYPVPAQYTSSHYPSTNVPYSQSPTHERQQYYPPERPNDENNESSSSTGSDEDEDEDESEEEEGEENDEENQRPPPSSSAGPSRSGGFPVSSSRYEGR